MQLADYQKKCFQKLYDGLVNINQHVIAFWGPKGCGKTTVIEELVDALLENWQVYKLSGTGAASPPYYTWYASSQKSVTKPHKHICDISFGISFEPKGLPVGMELSVGFSENEACFNNNEYTILQAVKKQSAANEHILFIADDYTHWDEASKALLHKIILVKGGLFGPGKQVHMVVIDDSIDLDQLSYLVQSEVYGLPVGNISLIDITQILEQQTYIKALHPVDIEGILLYTGYDLRLISLAAHYQQENNDTQQAYTIEDLLERRIASMPEEQKTICETLEQVSIIDTLFSEKEAAYLLEKELVHTEEMLDKATNMRLIRKCEAYDFPNQQIRKYFEDKLRSKKKYLHYKFAIYLKKNYPEDYLGRAHHLFLSENAYSDQNILEAVLLLAVELVRRKCLTGGFPEKALENKLAQAIDQLPPSILRLVQENIRFYQEGYMQMSHYEYIQAIEQFESINLFYASKVFSMEVLRLKLVCYIQLADDLKAIRQQADELYEQIADKELNEDEQWCRSALVLMEVYGDRHINHEKFLELRNRFESCIRRHMFSPTFQSLHADFACKASLFYNSVIAVKLTEESHEYYKVHNNISHQYFSLCNNAANRIICGEYELADKRLEECRLIIEESKGFSFPSIYKVQNNLILLKFLQSEGTPFDYKSRNKKSIMAAARQAADKFSALVDKQGYEVSHVIECNLVSMQLLSGDKKAAHDILLKFGKEYRFLDVFYKYYYHNACCAYHLLQNEYLQAAQHLDLLEELDVILLSNFNKILHKRNQLIHLLIEEKFEGDAFEYNYVFLKKGIRVQDPTASFWGRGLLLSDLQFLTL